MGISSRHIPELNGLCEEDAIVWKSRTVSTVLHLKCGFRRLTIIAFSGAVSSGSDPWIIFGWPSGKIGRRSWSHCAILEEVK